MNTKITKPGIRGGVLLLVFMFVVLLPQFGTIALASGNAHDFSFKLPFDVDTIEHGTFVSDTNELKNAQKMQGSNKSSQCTIKLPEVSDAPYGIIGLSEQRKQLFRFVIDDVSSFNRIVSHDFVVPENIKGCKIFYGDQDKIAFELECPGGLTPKSTVTLPIPASEWGIDGYVIWIDGNGEEHPGEVFLSGTSSTDSSNWEQDNTGNWYYLKDGKKVTGWVEDGGKWYYMADNGVMKTGWVEDGDKWYYLKSSGAMATGWQNVGKAWYYLKPTGDMEIGWLSVGGKWYYLESSGAMVTGWKQVGGKWYYLDSSGVMKENGWQNDSNNWYYLQSSGAMKTNGWVESTKGTWYYVNGSGKMVTGTQKIGGKTYSFNAKGVWIS